MIMLFILFLKILNIRFENNLFKKNKQTKRIKKRTIKEIIPQLIKFKDVLKIDLKLIKKAKDIAIKKQIIIFDKVFFSFLVFAIFLNLKLKYNYF